MAGILSKSLIPLSLSGPVPYLPTVPQLILITGSTTHKIDSFITPFQQLPAKSSQSEPLRVRFHTLWGLATMRLHRHRLSNSREDLDEAILNLTELILLPPRLWLERGSNIVQALFILARALLERSEGSDQLEDATYAAKYLRHLRDQPHATVGFLRHAVTALLLDVMELQLDLEASNTEEMAVLFHELLASDASDADTTRSVTLLVRAVPSMIRLFVPDQPLNQVIECLRLAKMHKPRLRKAHVALFYCLFVRYCMTFVNDDYEEAASILDEIIASSSPGDSQDEDVTVLRRIVTVLAVARSRMHDTPEYSEEAMYRARAFLSSSPVEHPLNHFVNQSLEGGSEQRLRHFGSIDGLETSSSNSPLSQPVQVVSFGEYEDDDSDFGRGDKTKLLRGLLSGIHDDDITKVDEAIEKGRTMLPPGPSDWDTVYYFAEFGDVLFEAFLRTKKIEYINESIDTRRRALESLSQPALRFRTLNLLSLSLCIRSLDFPGHCAQDLDEALELLPQCVNDERANLPDRFLLACWWATFARLNRHPSVSTAYESTVSLMQDTLLFAPTLQLQHANLAKTSYASHSMPLDYASYQVDLHQLEEAIVTLERGRALLWSEMRRLRASVDQLPQADSDLGHKFAVINRDLETLTKSISPSHKVSTDDGAADDLRAVDSFGRLLLKQRGLLKERDNLISQIQALPGFDSFLTSPSFDTLRSAASSGPVVIINHSIWRSDILILLHNTSPSLIPTPDDFYPRSSALKDELLDSRHKHGLDSSHYDKTLAYVLAELYKLVGKPVVDRLRELKVPEQSRIWWCPTSVFCSLPLHAMGPIPSDEGEMRYFLDLYICSYTPTLSALIQSRNRNSGSRSSDRPSLLLVAQPDPSLPTVGGEIQVVQALDTEVTSLISEAATRAAVINGFDHNRFVHFACHGTLEAGKPFEAGFELYGERLTLLEIVRSHLPTAEFAFLSACHTAEVTEGSIMDEGLHLAAAVQYCGFRSVVGTTWAMLDEDGRELAEHFYKALFSTSRREQGIPYHERSAKALRFAVKKLRRKRWITLERWVNFVHYGA